MDPVPPGWQGILDPGERILWQGRPDGRVDFTRGSLRQAAFGLPFLVFGLTWMTMTWQVVRDAPLPGILFPMIGLFITLSGLWQTIGTFLWDAYLRRHTWYTLTDRRAFVATQVMGRRTLRDWPVDAETLLDYDGALPGTIWFAEAGARDRRFGRRGRVGFEMLPDARAVHGLMRKVQRREA